MKQERFSPNRRLRIRRQRADLLQERNVRRRRPTDADDFDATIGGNRMPDADRHVYSTTRMKGQMDVVGIVVNRAFTLEDENRVFRYRVDMRDVRLAGLEHNVIQIRSPRSGPGPNHKARVLRNQRQTQGGMIPMEYSDSHLHLSFSGRRRD